MPSYGSMSELELVALLVSGDERAFEFLYLKHVRGLHRYAQSRLRSEQESKEMVQNIFVTLWEKRESLAHLTALTPYLFHMLKNKVVEHYRHNLVREQYAADFAFFESCEHNPTEDQQNLDHARTLIEDSVSAMPPRMQMAFRLSREENLSIVHIAERMKITPRTAETLITNALKRLRTFPGRVLALLLWLDSL